MQELTISEIVELVRDKIISVSEARKLLQGMGHGLEDSSKPCPLMHYPINLPYTAPNTAWGHNPYWSPTISAPVITYCAASGATNLT